LELRKLHRAEQQQPGTWARSLKLCYHLGLLQHLFPWLQPQHLGCSPLAATQVQQQAVQVAERVGQAWRGRGVPLVLLVAATLHPAHVNRRQAMQQVRHWEA
jgi:tRNA nucleotidyltransferase/poly(A) polymerase